MTSGLLTRLCRVTAALAALTVVGLLGPGALSRAAAAPYPPSNPCQVSVAPGSAAAGDSAVVSGINMGLGSAVQVSLLPGGVRLADTSADDTGSFAVGVRLPSGLSAGPHTVQAESSVATCATTLRITASASTSPTSKPSRTSIPTPTSSTTATSSPTSSSHTSARPTPTPSATPGASFGIGGGVSTHRPAPGGAGVAGTVTHRPRSSAASTKRGTGGTVPTAPGQPSRTVVSAPPPPSSTHTAPTGNQSSSAPPLANEPLLPFGRRVLALIALALAATAACALLLLSVLARRH